MEDKSNGKFKILSESIVANILNFITASETISILTEINKHFSRVIEKIYRKDISLSSCLKEMKNIIKQTDEFKFITKDHCISLEENLRKIKDSYNPYTFNKSVYLLASLIFINIQSLDLQKNNMGLDGVILLIPLIRKSVCLFHLNLAYNNIADDGSKFFALALKKNSSLQILNMECNGISDPGILLLSDAIGNHKNLKTVKLALNLITFIGAKNLACSLEKSCSRIVVVDLKYNNIIVKDDFHIDYFRKNKIAF
jgi:hypothetical protein